jgi:hypothetical protein
VLWTTSVSRSQFIRHWDWVLQRHPDGAWMLGKVLVLFGWCNEQGRLRCRSVHSVIDSSVPAKEGVEFVTFFDDNVDRLEADRTPLRLDDGLGFHLDWAIESRIDTVSPRLCELGQSGCKYIQFGIESGVQAI